MKEKDQIIIEDVADASVELGIATLEEIVEITPFLSFAWKLANAQGRAGLKLRHKKALEFVENIQDNPEIFTETLLKSECFQDGFVYAIEKYTRERNVQKRNFMKTAFLGFGKSNNLENFKLEKIYTTLSNISMESIEYLSFLNSVVIPLMKMDIEKEAGRLVSPSSDYNWWVQHKKDHSPVSKYINKWIHENYSPSIKEVKEKHNYNESLDPNKILLQQMFDLEEVEQKKYREAMAEFVSLGLCRVIVDGGGGLGNSGGRIEHAFVIFGWEFLEYLKK